ncbi:MAG: hypothetical protein IJH20_04160 [Bacilli bacterium]|nr:hypothetical protein [Bacilli bacterium]
MDKFRIIINELKDVKDIDYNEQNFYSPANEERYQAYLNEFVLRYVTDVDSIMSCIQETNFKKEAGIYQNGDEISCLVPKRETLYDEMVCIHEITHLIHCLENGEEEDDITKEIVPYFNEYDYLKRIHPFYAKYYEKFRLWSAVHYSKRLRGLDEDNFSSHIYAYFVLEQRKNDYDIDKLNQINSKHGKLKSPLNKKGYTLKI